MKIGDYYKEKYYIHYCNCHEDANFVMKNIANSPKKILSIASALDNSLALLLLDPQEVVAIDSNPTQIYLCELKKCAIKYLEYEEYLIFLGIKQGDPLEYYGRIKNRLSGQARSYFDGRLFLISEVLIVNCGRFEYYFSIFKNKILPLVHSKKKVLQFMNCVNLQEQRRFYDKKFNNLRFKLIFKLFFSKAVMKKLGRDKEYFKHNEGSLSAMLKERFENCIYNNLNSENPYLQYVVLNKFERMPLYLEKENFALIKERIDAIKIKKIEFCDQIKSGEKYDLAYLSDIFEYMSQEQTDALCKDLSNS